MADVYTDVGEAETVDALDTALSTPFIAWGTGAGTAAKGDTTLFTEASEARVSATKSQPAADTLRNVATITADGTKTITNAGLFDASTVGNMLVKGDFTGIALNLSESIEFTIDLQFS
jgi:hypothetical protein